MFGRYVTHHNGKMVSPYMLVFMSQPARHYSNVKRLLAKYTQQLADAIRHPHKLLLAHIQRQLNSVHALLIIQAVKHGKVKLTALTVSTVNQCLVVGLRLPTPVRQTHHHVKQA
jgi:hypothetical protein